MIPFILCVFGIILVVFALVGFIRLLLLPYTRINEVVFKREDDFLKYETRDGKKYFKRNLKEAIWIYVIVMVIGVSSFFLGIYFGHAAKGDSFWFYKQIYGEDNSADHWDKITDDGKFISDDGTEYTYFIIVTGSEYDFCGKSCADYEELSMNVQEIRRDNTIILIDSFAVSSAYHQAERLLTELGIKYETEEE